MSRLTSSQLTLLLTCSWIIAVSGDIEVTVNPGDDATLDCRASSHGSIKQIAWSKTDLNSDEYVFFLRGNRSNEDYQHSSFHGRVELRDPQMKQGDASVVLKNVTTDDSGPYECVVSMSRGGRRRKRAADFTHFVRLKVEDSGPTAGGSEEGGRKETGNLRVHSGLIVPLGAAVVGVIFVSVVLVLKKRPMKKKSEHLAADEQLQLSSPELVEVQASA